MKISHFRKLIRNLRKQTDGELQIRRIDSDLAHGKTREESRVSSKRHRDKGAK